MARVTAIAAALCVCAAAATGWAQSSNNEAPAIHLDVVAPDECPSEEELRLMILEFAGPQEGESAQLTALIEFHRTDDGSWLARVETLSRAHAGDREFRGATCDEVATAAAALLALAVDMPPAAPAPRPAADARVHKPAAPPPEAETPPPTPAPPRSNARFLAQVVGGADVGALPGLVPAFGIGIGVVAGSFRINVGVDLWQATNVDLERELGAGATLGLWTLGARACYPVWKLGFCAGGEWGIMRGESYGIEMPRAETGHWVAATAAVTGSWPLWRRLDLVAEVGAVAPVVSPRFLVQGQLLHVPEALAGRTRLGVQMRFP